MTRFEGQWPPMILYRAHLLDAPQPRRLREVRDGALVVDGLGRIAAAGAFEAVRAAHPEVEVRDLRPHWILPGLVDLHVHLPQYEAVAMDGLELLPWLETFIFPSEMRFADAEVARRSARHFFSDLLRLGTTTAVVYTTIHAEATHAAFEEAELSGIRCAMGKVMMDRHAPQALREDPEASLLESEALIQRWHGRDHGRLLYALAPRFAPSCTPELLRGAGDLSEKYGCFVQTHLSENLDEIRWVKGLFPESRHYTDVYRRHGLLHARVLFGHGIHLDPDERRMIRDAGATLVHCPSSNAFLKSGIMPLRRWCSEGLSVGLGTDVGAGTSLSMWAEAAMACTASKLLWARQHATQEAWRYLWMEFELLGEDGRQIKRKVEQALGQGERSEAEAPVMPPEAFHLATAAGARALGLQDRIGTLDAGKDADFVVVDPRVPDPGRRAEDAAERMLSRLLYRADPAMLAATVVRGKVCHGLI